MPSETTAAVAPAARPPALSKVVAKLEDMFSAIRRQHRELPEIIVVVATGAEGKKGVTHWGHFAPRRWIRHTAEKLADGTELPAMAEIKIAAEGLNRPVEEVFETLLHEAAHAIAEVRGIKDTSDLGRYHNAAFAKLATEVGLIPPEQPVRRHGYAFTAPSPRVRERYGRQLDDLATALRIYRVDVRAAPKSGSEAGKPKRVAVRCGCDRSFQVVPSVLAQGPIMCGACDTPFLPAGGDPRDSCEECAALGDDCQAHGAEGID